MKLSFFKYSFFAVLFLGILASCTKEYEGIEQIDDRNIQAYIKQNNLTSMQQYSSTGMYYQINTPGQGTAMAYSDKVPLVFTFRTLDNSFSSTDTISNHYSDFLGYFSLEGVRTGIKEILIKRGGQVRLIVPSRSAYGREGFDKIPGNVSLDVTVRALDVAGLPVYDDVSITKYLQANNLTGFTKSSKGIYYKISDPGTGSNITVDSTVTANYTGKYINGTVFDTATSAVFQLTSLVPAWQQIIPLIKEGGSVRFITPSAQGYGTRSSDRFPVTDFSILDFDVKVTSVSP